MRETHKVSLYCVHLSILSIQRKKKKNATVVNHTVVRINDMCSRVELLADLPRLVDEHERISGRYTKSRVSGIFLSPLQDQSAVHCFSTS